MIDLVGHFLVFGVGSDYLFLPPHVGISHDRWFLNRIATQILAFEGDGQVAWFEDNYQDFEADRHRRLGSDADQPHRIKHKPLVRL